MSCSDDDNTFQSIDLVGWARTQLTITYHWSNAIRWQIRTQMHARIFGSRANVVLFFGKFVVERNAVKIERTECTVRLIRAIEASHVVRQRKMVKSIEFIDIQCAYGVDVLYE